MKLFRPAVRRDDHRDDLYARFELFYTLVDFAAAVSFLVGSVLFFYEKWQTPATWLFVIGSVLFAMKPTLRLIREIKLYSIGDTKDLAKRLKE